jgi:hypothetical protein
MKHFYLFLLFTGLLHAQDFETVKKQLASKYEYISDLKDNTALVRTKSGKMGAVDSLGTIIILIKYDYITEANEDQYIVELKQKYALFNKDGKPVTDFIFSGIERYSNGTATVKFPDQSSAIINTAGQPLFTPVKNHSLKILDNKDGIYQIKDDKTNKYGLIDSKGILVIPCQYNDTDYVNGLAKVQLNKKYGLYTLDNKEVLPIAYEYIFPVKNNSFICVKDKKYGVSNSMGQFIVPLEYEYIDEVQEKYFAIRDSKGNSGILNADGQTIIPVEYKFYRIWKEKIFAAKDGRPMILDIQNPTEQQAVQADSFIIEDNYYEDWNKQVFTKEGRYGAVDINGNIIVPATYDDLKPIYLSGEFIAKQKGKYGIVNAKNEIVQPIIFDSIRLIKENAVLTKKGQKTILHYVKYRDYPIDFNN